MRYNKHIKSNDPCPYGRYIMPRWFRNIITGIKNIIRWAPTLYNDRDWDFVHIYEILQRKLLYQRNHIVFYNFTTKTDEVNRDITICLNLLESLKSESYSLEYTNYRDNYEVYFNMNRKTYREVCKHLIERKRDGDNQLRALYISKFKQEKARKLFFRILEEKIQSWWD